MHMPLALQCPTHCRLRADPIPYTRLYMRDKRCHAQSVLRGSLCNPFGDTSSFENRKAHLRLDAHTQDDQWIIYYSDAATSYYDHHTTQILKGNLIIMEYLVKISKKGTISVKIRAASLFGKLKYEKKKLLDSIYETEKSKSLVSTTPLSTVFISISIVQNFQDSPNNEEETRSSHEYLNDLEEEYQARALLAKSKRLFKKGTQRFGSAKAIDQTECHKYGKKELRPTKEFKAKYNNVKAKLALLSSSASASKAATIKNKGLIAEAYEWDEEEVDLVHELNACKEQLLLLKQAKLDFLTMQHVNTEILKENKNLRTELKELTTITEIWLNSSNKFWAKRPSLCTKVSIPGVERPWLSEAEGFILPNYDTGRILPVESQRNTIDPSIVVIESSATDYDLADESSVCSAPLPPPKKLDASKVNSAPAGKLKSVTIEDDHPLAIVMKELKDLKLQISKNQSSYSRNNHSQQCERTDHRTCDHVDYISIKNMSQHLKSLGRSSSKPKNPRPSKHFFPPCIHCGFSDHLSDDCVNYPICDICGSYDHDIHVRISFETRSLEYHPHVLRVGDNPTEDLSWRNDMLLVANQISHQFSGEDSGS
ncbi:hypothetical protein Tco_1156157 [Tanacetum coccineum]